VSNKKILILEGGNNEEHDVSLVTSREIQKILNQNKLKFKILRVNPKNFHKKIINYKNFVCINALHGPFGEDGQTQKILKKNKIPFSHSNIKSSNLCFNKSASKREIIKNKLPFDLLSIELRDGIQNLSKITGQELTEEILDNIFSKFCIGK